MNPKLTIQIALLLILSGVGIYYWSGFFRPPEIQILCTIHRQRSTRAAEAGNPAAGSLRAEAAFGLDKNYKLTSIKVVPLADWKTNKNAHPLWQLAVKTAVTPVKAFIYGQKFKGMDSVSGTDAEPLLPRVEYLLLIEAGRQRGECEFTLP